MATAELEYVPLEKDGLQPLVVQFTNGSLKTSRKGTSKDGISFSYFRWKDSSDFRKKYRRTLTAKTDHMEYVGQNFGQFARVNNFCKYLVGVLDKDTGKMKIYDSQLFMMQPKVLEKAAVSLPNDEVDGKKELSFTEKSDRLTEAFGSNKKKKSVASRKKNAIDRDDLDSTVMDAVQGELFDLTQEEQKTPASEPSSIIPPYNIQAKEPSEVYNLDYIITPAEYDILRKAAKEFEGANKELIDQWREQKRYPEYILQHLAAMPLNPSQRAHRSCLLLYLSYLIQMYLLKYKDLRKKDPLQEYGYPDKIKQKLLSMFTLENPQKSKTIRLVPKRLRDKLLSYILVLALIIDEYVMGCLVIAKDLKMDPKKLSNHLKVLGCSIETSGTTRKRKADESSTETRTATLKVPLPPNFPNI